MVALCLLVSAGIGYAIWFWPAGSAEQAARNRNANQPIPVLVATAEQKDVPIFLDALGTVQAFNTVTVKPMVDGPLIAVNFAEGPGGEEGRPAGADRSAHLPGGARPGGRQEGAGRGAACQRAARPGALPEAGGQQLQRPPSRPIRRARRWRSSRRRCNRTRRRSTRHGRSLATPRSPRRSMDEPACARSMPATSSTRRTRRAW